MESSLDYHIHLNNKLSYRQEDDTLYGEIEIPSHQINDLTRLVSDIYQAIFTFVENRGSELCFVRHFVPNINARIDQNFKSTYELFNKGRHEAFVNHFGPDMSKWKIPAASAIGNNEDSLKIKFTAVKNIIAVIENNKQTSSFRYSEKYGKYPPVFSRGAIVRQNGQIKLMAAGTASISGEESVHHDSLYAQIYKTIENLRVLGSQFNLKSYGIEYGFAVEDIREAYVYYKRTEDLAYLQNLIPKFFSSVCTIRYIYADICRDELLVEIEAVFIKKGNEQAGKKKYYSEGSRIVTESFELHVSEHCNLKCVECCNISPYNSTKFMSMEEVRDICSFVKKNLRPEVIKISGGEPLLHPKLEEIVKTIKEYDLGAKIRITTNGLLAKRLTPEIWQSIDQLWVSNYQSAPVSEKTISLIKENAEHFGVILNIKYVDQFNKIFSEALRNERKIQEIYDDCWMRHRCLMVRNGHFYKCTRAAYLNDYLNLTGLSEDMTDVNFSEEDGIPIQAPDFQDMVLGYLNSDTPLKSCRYCLGVSGELITNQQMKTSGDKNLKR